MAFPPHHPAYYGACDGQPASPPPHEAVYLQTELEFEEEERAAKRQRIADVAADYLAGHILYISTASLNGPFEGGWKNPWRRPFRNGIVPLDERSQALREELARRKDLEARKPSRVPARRERSGHEQFQTRVPGYRDGLQAPGNHGHFAMERLEAEHARSTLQHVRPKPREATKKDAKEEWLRKISTSMKTPDLNSDSESEVGTPSRSTRAQGAYEASHLTTPPETDSASEINLRKKLNKVTPRPQGRHKITPEPQHGSSQVFRIQASSPESVSIEALRGISPIVRVQASPRSSAYLQEEDDISNLIRVPASPDEPPISPTRDGDQFDPGLEMEAERVEDTVLEHSELRGRLPSKGALSRLQATEVRCTSSNRLHRSQMQKAMEGLRPAKRLPLMALESESEGEAEHLYPFEESSQMKRLSQAAVSSLPPENIQDVVYAASPDPSSNGMLSGRKSFSGRSASQASNLLVDPQARSQSVGAIEGHTIVKPKASGKLSKTSKPKKLELSSPGFVYKKRGKAQRNPSRTDTELRKDHQTQPDSPKIEERADADGVQSRENCANMEESANQGPLLPQAIPATESTTQGHQTFTSTTVSVPHVSGVFAQNPDAFTTSGPSERNNTYEHPSTQAAFAIAQEAFFEGLKSPMDDSMFPIVSDSDSQSNMPAVVDTITPFKDFNLRIRKSLGGKNSALRQRNGPGPSTQDLLDAASPFSFSTVKKPRTSKRTSFVGLEPGSSTHRPSNLSIYCEKAEEEDRNEEADTPSRHHRRRHAHHGTTSPSPALDALRAKTSSANLPLRTQSSPKRSQHALSSSQHDPAFSPAFINSPMSEQLDLDLTSFSITSGGALEEGHMHMANQTSQEGQGGLFGDDPDFDVDAAIEEAGSFLRSWDVEGELRSVKKQMAASGSATGFGESSERGAKGILKSSGELKGIA